MRVNIFEPKVSGQNLTDIISYSKFGVSKFGGIFRVSPPPSPLLVFHLFVYFDRPTIGILALLPFNLIDLASLFLLLSETMFSQPFH